jgi:DnaK suppressor protein
LNDERARILVAAERTRIERALSDLTASVRSEGPLQRQQTGEAAEVGTDLENEGVEMALVDGLRLDLAAVVLAEARIAAGTYGKSVEDGAPIPDARLEAAPLAERTVEQQLSFERSRARV